MEDQEKTNRALDELKAKYEQEIKTLKAEAEKYKNTASRNATEVADYKRKWQDTLSETEKAKIERQTLVEEKEKYAKQLKIMQETTKYISLGYEKDKAEKIATAYADGDSETVFAIQKEFIEQLRDKNKEDKTRKTPYPSGSAANKDLTQDEYNKLGVEGLTKLAMEQPELFAKFNK